MLLATARHVACLRRDVKTVTDNPRAQSHWYLLILVLNISRFEKADTSGYLKALNRVAAGRHVPR